MNIKYAGRAFVAATGLALAVSTAHGAAPQLLSDREMSGVYGQGLDGSTLEALTSDDANRTWATSAAAPGAPGAALGGYAALAALSANGSQSLQDRLAQLEQQAATHGLQNGIALQRTLAAASGFAVNATFSMTIPVMNIPFFFGFGFPALPPIPPSKDKGGH
jgi:hypothetical protein